ncbi:hypothetical protein [Tardiphaga sp.]|uniref:hypothetical protein n=1 Tax=Tardiphaga sp. TaxID=1926292 RepID=UPI002625FE73|nr:hypothetical protein [Tardiphaga sp.]MDB5620775.1 hypothetical protein [Tardiphaga sp.]
MSAQPVKVSDITDESSAQTYLDQMIMTTFCRVLDTSRLPPSLVMRLIATALGTTYREVASAHLDGQCPCGWCPLPTIDIEALRSSLEEAAAPKRIDDLHSMVVAGRA